MSKIARYPTRSIMGMLGALMEHTPQLRRYVSHRADVRRSVLSSSWLGPTRRVEQKRGRSRCRSCAFVPRTRYNSGRLHRCRRCTRNELRRVGVRPRRWLEMGCWAALSSCQHVTLMLYSEHMVETLMVGGSPWHILADRLSNNQSRSMHQLQPCGAYLRTPC